jgi:DNA-directed RNA polymerase I, II, and III subunit RPABC2
LPQSVLARPKLDLKNDLLFVEDISMADEGEDYDDQYVDDDLDLADDGALVEDAQKKDLGNELMRFHPEARIDTIETVTMDLQLTNVPPSFLNADGQADPKHRSVPFLTQFEKTKILGFRTNQLSQGARAFIAVPAHVTDLREIARMELEARRLPFIIKRPMPDGTFEKWRLSDLLIL